jgi:recombinational DNA repair protein (RecF pathway)
MRDQRTNSGMPDLPANKRCAGCQTTKAVEEFYADRRGRLTGRCRDCHRQETRASNRRRHVALRLLITAHLEEYRALLAAQRPRHDGDRDSIAGGDPDVA